MAKVTVYSTTYCGFCDAAKHLLRSLDVDFDEIDLTGDPEGRTALVQRSGGKRTVPQIFIGDHHVGGFTELRGVVTRGELDDLLEQAGITS